MDASATKTDVMGRPTGPRRRRSNEEKRRIVQEALQPGASVAQVARRHELNANVLFIWRRQYLKGAFGSTADLIPVKLIDGQPGSAAVAAACTCTRGADLIELKTAAGIEVRVSGELARKALREIIAQVLPR